MYDLAKRICFLDISALNYQWFLWSCVLLLWLIQELIISVAREGERT